MVGKMLVGIGATVALVGLGITVFGGAQRAVTGLAIVGMGTAPLVVGLGLTLLRRYTVHSDD
jgi:hypothetical protein